MDGSGLNNSVMATVFDDKCFFGHIVIVLIQKISKTILPKWETMIIVFV